jgi:hypothetical protein
MGQAYIEGVVGLLGHGGGFLGSVGGGVSFRHLEESNLVLGPAEDK